MPPQFVSSRDIQRTARVDAENPVIVITTTGDRGLAERIATELVDLCFAACVQIEGPLTSVFRWEARIQTDDEYRLVIKTVADRIAEVKQLVVKRHNYDVPELIVLPITGGSDEYLDWLRRETNRQRS